MEQDEKRPSRPEPAARNIVVQSSQKIDNVSLAYGGKTDKNKKSKRRYIIDEDHPLPEIRQESPESYRNFIIQLLVQRGNVKRSEAEAYTDQANMPSFFRAITHDSVNPEKLNENYEMYEHLGDATVNKCATWYLKNRFPEIIKLGDKGVEIISKQKSLIVSKPLLARYADLIGISKFIRFRPLKFSYDYVKKGNGPAQDEKLVASKQIVLDRSMREDVFEAFFGCLEEVIDNKEGFVGVGYAVVFKILSSIYDEQVIPTLLSELVDASSQLKELFDSRKVKYGDTRTYIVDAEAHTMRLELDFKGDPRSAIKRPMNITFGPISTDIQGSGPDTFSNNTKILEQKLAREALTYLRSRYGDEFVGAKYAD